MFEVIYIPRVEEEIIVAQFDTEEEANAWMRQIKVMRPKSYPHHYVKEQQCSTY
jgi:hypothetical protein